MHSEEEAIGDGREEVLSSLEEVEDGTFDVVDRIKSINLLYSRHREGWTSNRFWNRLC